jgi:hypothetical protein
MSAGTEAKQKGRAKSAAALAAEQARAAALDRVGLASPEKAAMYGRVGLGTQQKDHLVVKLTDEERRIAFLLLPPTDKFDEVNKTARSLTKRLNEVLSESLARDGFKTPVETCLKLVLAHSKHASYAENPGAPFTDADSFALCYHWMMDRPGNIETEPTKIWRAKVAARKPKFAGDAGAGSSSGASSTLIVESKGEKKAGEVKVEAKVETTELAADAAALIAKTGGAPAPVFSLAAPSDAAAFYQQAIPTFSQPDLLDKAMMAAGISNAGAASSSATAGATKEAVAAMRKQVEQAKKRAAEAQEQAKLDRELAELKAELATYTASFAAAPAATPTQQQSSGLVGEGAGYATSSVSPGRAGAGSTLPALGSSAAGPQQHSAPGAGAGHAASQAVGVTQSGGSSLGLLGQSHVLKSGSELWTQPFIAGFQKWTKDYEGKTNFVGERKAVHFILDVIKHGGNVETYVAKIIKSVPLRAKMEIAINTISAAIHTLEPDPAGPVVETCVREILAAYKADALGGGTEFAHAQARSFLLQSGPQPMSQADSVQFTQAFAAHVKAQSVVTNALATASGQRGGKRRNDNRERRARRGTDLFGEPDSAGAAATVQDAQPQHQPGAGAARGRGGGGRGGTPAASRS